MKDLVSRTRTQTFLEKINLKESARGMLIKGINIMSNLALIGATVKAGLEEIAKQADALATGLQNAAPGDKKMVPNPSVQYLFDIADAIKQEIKTLSQESK